MDAQTRTAVETLRHAAGLIERKGLLKGAYFKGYDPEDIGLDYALRELMAGGEEPKCCTLGALYWSAGEVLDMDDLVFQATQEAIGLGADEIPAWNDKPGQRKDRVVAALRRAATHLEEKNK